MKCPKCEGCGRVANTDDEEPWSAWLSVPVGSALAVLAGVVKPKPCPSCGGSGGLQEPTTPALDELRTEIDRLSRLLADPHPGLSTWNLAVANAIARIAAFAGQPR